MFQQVVNVVRGAFSKSRLLVCINIAGLSIALAASLIIVFYVQHETSYDKHWQQAERIYRVNNNFDLPGRAPYRLATTSSLLVPALQEAFTDEIELAARARTMDIVYRVGAERFQASVVAVDPVFVELFALNTVLGSMSATLSSTAGIALTEDLARTLFGTANVLDRTLTVEYPTRVVDYRVSAVFKMPAGKSVLELPALISFDETLEPQWPLASLGTWNQAPVASYLQLRPGIDARTLQARLDVISDNNFDIAPLNAGPDTKPSDLLFFDLSSISQLHLDPDFQNVRGTGNRATVQAFALIASLILVLACINFAYLTLAKSVQRTSEVGIRKILGASRRQLLQQYLGEAFVLVGAALMMGLVLVELLLPYLVNVLGLPLQIDYRSVATYLNVFAIYLLIALLGGLYPALMLARSHPSAALRARAASPPDTGLSFQNVLLVFQFGVAIALIIATTAIYLQIEFVSHRDPGFRQDKLLLITDIAGREAVNANKQVLRERIKGLSDVSDVSLSSYHPLATTTYARVTSAHSLEGRTGESFFLANTFVDEDFFATYNIAVMAGRSFSLDQDQPVTSGEWLDRPADTGPRTALINHAAARFLGFTDPGDALGKLIDSRYTIIGVVADNQFYSLKAVTRPEIYFFHPAVTDVLSISYQGSGELMLEKLRNLWRGTMGDAVFTVSFIEAVLAREFFQERREGQMLVVFALFSMFIACLGLYGASAFSVERRTKEIGIRKVMGAEIRQIVTLLLWQFSKPVLLANVIAWPAALWGILMWLQKFPYQIDVVILIPLCGLAGAVALLIAWLTVAGDTLRVAGAAPVLALRYE